MRRDATLHESRVKRDVVDGVGSLDETVSGVEDDRI